MDIKKIIKIAIQERMGDRGWVPAENLLEELADIFMELDCTLIEVDVELEDAEEEEEIAADCEQEAWNLTSISFVPDSDMVLYSYDVPNTDTDGLTSDEIGDLVVGVLDQLHEGDELINLWVSPGAGISLSIKAEG